VSDILTNFFYNSQVMAFNFKPVSRWTKKRRLQSEKGSGCC